MKKKVLVFGLGHIAQNKVDVAVRVVDYLRKRSSIYNLELFDSTSCVKNLSECIESAEQMIVIDTDAAEIKQDTVHVYEGFEMDAFIKHRKDIDIHTAVLRDALKLAVQKGKLPRHRALVGIGTVSANEYAIDEFELDTAISRACQKVFEITECWKI